MSASNSNSRGQRSYRRESIFLVILALCCLTCFLLLHYQRPPRSGYPFARWVGPPRVGAYVAGRNAAIINKIIISTTEHDAAYAKKLWLESDSISGHYIVTRVGKVLQFVDDMDTAFHAGNRAYNESSISVALEGYASPKAHEGHYFQEKAEFDAAVDICRWLSKRFSIPIDREHIFGKNQVPGICRFPGDTTGPSTWGGASNKYAPGPTWNWTKFMIALGRPAESFVVLATKDTDVRTFPSDDAPVISHLWQGQRAVSVDRAGDHYLVIVVGSEKEQINLRSGEYHWDGWIPKSAIIADDNAKTRVITESETMTVPVYETLSVPLSNPVWTIASGKLVALTGAEQEDSNGRYWVQIDVMDPKRKRAGWVNKEYVK